MIKHPTDSTTDTPTDGSDEGARHSVPGPFRALALSVALAATAAACASTSLASPGEGELPPVDTPYDGDPDESGAVDPGRPDEPGRSDDAVDPGAPVAPIAPVGDTDLGVGGIELAPSADTEVSALPDGRTVVQGEVTIPTGDGAIELEDADIAVGVGPDGAPTVAGTARVPFPTDGAFAGAQINQLPIGQMGSAYGRDLAHLGAHLNDDTHYLFFAFDDGLDVELPFAGQEGYEAIPSSISVPAGVNAALVLDPTDPYFYLGTDCPDMSDDEDDRNDDRDDDGSESEDSQDDERRNDDAPEEPQQDDESGETYYTIEPTNLPAGQECGIGLSMNGNIPAPAAADGEAFFGHVVVDGVVPLYAGMELDGSAVVALRDPGVQTVGWGTVLATVPLIESIVDVQIPLAEAAVEIQAEGTRIGVAFDGSVGGEDPTYELPLVGVPITVPASGTAEWNARFGFVEQGGDWAIEPSSYAEFSGEFGVGLGSFGEMIGVELSNVGTQAGSFRIDATGVTATGSTALQIHPALRSGAATEFSLRIDPTDWAQTRFDMVADVELGGYTIGSADVSIGGQGLAVAGEVDFGFVRTGVTGRIDAAGFELTGAAAVDLSLDGMAEASRDASDWLQQRIDEVERLDDDIERAREEVRVDRRERDANFTAARNALQRAIDGLDDLDEETRQNNAKIAELERKIDDEKDRYADLNAGEKVLEGAAHVARLAGWRTDITARKARNFAIDDVYRPAAVVVLSTAQDALDLVQQGLDALPVDTHPTVAALIAARVTAVGALELAQGTVELFEIEGSVRGEVQLRLASDGVGGSFSGELCGPTGCTNLPGGSVQLGAEPAVCVELPGLGDTCLRL